MSNEQIFNSGKTMGKAEEKTDNLLSKASSATSSAVDSAKQTGAGVTSMAQDAAGTIGDKASSAMDSIKSNFK